MMLSDYRGPELLEVFKSRLKKDTKSHNDVKSRFVRSIRRLGQLSKFAQYLGHDLEIDTIEIGKLTDKDNEDLEIRFDDPPEVIEHKEE